MKKSKCYLIKLITLLFFFYGCKEYIGLVTPSYTQNTPEELLGSWELKSGGQDKWKYLIIYSDNNYCNLISSNDNRHKASPGTYRITDNQINFWGYTGDGGLYTFSVSNDTLQLSGKGVVKTFIKNNDAPSKDEWVIPVTVIKEFPVHPQTRNLTYDGSFFWGTSWNYGDVIKFDTLGNILSCYNIPNSGGIAFGSNRLWISNYDTIKSVNPATGEIISTILIQSGNRIMSLTYESGFLWAFDIINDRIFKINESSGAVVKSIKFSPISGGFEFQGGKLWGIDRQNFYYFSLYNLYTFEPNNGNVLDSYSIPGIWSLSFDGKYMWAVGGYSSKTILVKLNIP